MSLCNVTCNLIAKLLVNQLKLHLHPLVSLEQKAFVAKRLITENLLIAYEAFCSIQMAPNGGPFMAIKVDIEHSYDCSCSD